MGSKGEICWGGKYGNTIRVAPSLRLPPPPPPPHPHTNTKILHYRLQENLGSGALLHHAPELALVLYRYQDYSGFTRTGPCHIRVIRVHETSNHKYTRAETHTHEDRNIPRTQNLFIHSQAHSNFRHIDRQGHAHRNINTHIYTRSHTHKQT
jgi:hypothetical protein